MAGITPVEVAAKLEGAPQSVVELTCRRLVQGQVACGCARVLGGMFLEAALSLVELLLSPELLSLASARFSFATLAPYFRKKVYFILFPDHARRRV